MVKPRDIVNHSNASVLAEPIVYGLVRNSDIHEVARIYVENFPARAQEFLQDERDVRNFFCDYMQLMRLAHGKTFYVARENDHLLGYLILALPGVALFPALVREGFLLTVAAHLLTRRYSLSRSLIAKLLKTFFPAERRDFVDELSSIPHISVFAVDSKCTGRGIGSGLMKHLRNTWQRDLDAVSLCVEAENKAAIRFYERMGFAIVKSSSSQHLMICDLGAT